MGHGIYLFRELFAINEVSPKSRWSELSVDSLQFGNLKLQMDELREKTIRHAWPLDSAPDDRTTRRIEKQTQPCRWLCLCDSASCERQRVIPRRGYTRRR